MGNFILTAQHGHAAGTSADRSEDLASLARDCLGAAGADALRELAKVQRERGESFADIFETFPNVFKPLDREFLEQAKADADAGLEKLHLMEPSQQGWQVVHVSPSSKPTRSRRARGELAPWAIAWVRTRLPLHRILAGLEQLGIADQFVDEDLNLSFSAPMVVDAIATYEPDHLPQGIKDRRLIADQLRLAFPHARFNTKRPRQMGRQVDMLSRAYEAGAAEVTTPRDAEQFVCAALLPILRPKV